jgi:predicted butyrate kinase (DUF1464 family)
MKTYTVVGVDPGSLSWDFFGLEGKKIILDASLPSKEVVFNPKKVIDVIKKISKIDLMVAPSGFGLPLKNVNELTEKDILFTQLKFNQDNNDELIGLGKVLNLLKNEKIPGIIVPGVKHLTTVPRYRKVNRVDMGTSDKLCTAVTGIRDQMDLYNFSPKETNFILLEIGYAFNAVLAIEDGQIIDGIGGSNIMGFRSCGSIDGELAYLIGRVKKNNIYRGGVATIAGYEDLSIEEIMLLSEKDERIKIALDAYISDVKKAVYSISSSFSSKTKIKEILLAGRGVDQKSLRSMISNELKEVAPVRLMKSYSHLSKHAAQGAAFIANGLLGGEFEPIIANMHLKDAHGSILDDIFIPSDNINRLSDFN